jgi:hypothetical protein
MPATTSDDGTRNRAEELRMRVAAVAAAATQADRQMVSEIAAMAVKDHPRGQASETYRITPGAAALIFVEHNAHNRDWDPVKTVELERRMRAGLWKRNNMSAGFYKDGALADGQHRFAAVALAGITWTTSVVFGMDREAITTVDCGWRRTAASALKMDGVEDPQLRETVVKRAAAYLVSRGVRSAALPSPTETVAAIQANAELLTRAITIAKTVEAQQAGPVLKLPVAATFVYLNLAAGVEDADMFRELRQFQTGQSTSTEAEPYYVAADMIAQSHSTESRKNKLSVTKELGLAITVFHMKKQEVHAIQKAKLRAMIRDTLPAPGYPVPPAQAAE